MVGASIGGRGSWEAFVHVRPAEVSSACAIIRYMCRSQVSPPASPSSYSTDVSVSCALLGLLALRLRRTRPETDCQLHTSRQLAAAECTLR